MLAPGDPLPDLELLASDGRKVRLHDCFGQRALVLYFYPKDHTFGCTVESCDFRDQYQQFLMLGAQVVGISKDDLESHRRFVQKHQLPFLLLSDPDSLAHVTFGVKRVLGLFPARCTFVATRPGVIQFVYRSELAFRAHASQALAALREHQ
jgi:peroxiredoxin Q/BCP